MNGYAVVIINISGVCHDCNHCMSSQSCSDWQQRSSNNEDGETTNTISTKSFQITEYFHVNRQKNTFSTDFCIQILLMS